MKNIVLLGSTGSVGKNVLDVVRHYPDKFRIRALCSNKNVDMLADQIKEFKPDVAGIADENVYSDLKGKVSENIKLIAGTCGLEELAVFDPADIVVIAISGTAALRPLVAALTAGRIVALASKEPIVSAGMIIRKIMEENNAGILPVDSEHSAIMQCMTDRNQKDVRTLYITGSGGALKDTKISEFDTLSVEQVLDHPTWDMGNKITVDSATLMNKGLEVIEARWLFDIPQEKIKVVIHPEAIIHSMVEFVDGTINASLFYPDMRFPILKALTFPDVIESDFPRVDFLKLKNFSFSAPDTKKFPALDLAFEALRVGETVPAVLNGSNEAAVNLFLNKKIKFTDIIKIVEKVVENHDKVTDPSLEDIVDSEKWAMEEVLRFC